jgi:hypothetical protein
MKLVTNLFLEPLHNRAEVAFKVSALTKAISPSIVLLHANLVSLQSAKRNQRLLLSNHAMNYQKAREFAPQVLLQR